MLTYLIRIVCLLSWSTVLLIPKKETKKYLPVTIFSGLLTVTTVLVGTHYNFWERKGSSKKRMWNHLFLVLGPFAVGNLWIFHLTYGKFGMYLLANLLNNFMYGFKLIPIIEKANYISYVKFTRIHHIILTMFESLVLYGYQMFLGRNNSKT